MNMLFLRTGAIYTFTYQYPKTNQAKIIAFILYGGVNKIHALSLTAIQLSTTQRLKFINIIRRLSSVDSSSYYNGRILYRIFRQYAPDVVRACYRTYHTHGVKYYALVNYGLNKKESFTEFEKRMTYSKQAYLDAKSNYVTTILNTFTRKGFLKSEAKNIFAQTRPEDISQNIQYG